MMKEQPQSGGEPAGGGDYYSIFIGAGKTGNTGLKEGWSDGGDHDSDDDGGEDGGGGYGHSFHSDNQSSSIHVNC